MKSPSLFAYFITFLILFISVASLSNVRSQSANIDCYGICDIAWSPSDEDLLAAVNELGLWFYDVNEAGNIPILFPFENATSLDFSPDGNSIVISACEYSVIDNVPCNGIVSRFDLENEIWEEIVSYDFPIDDIQFSPDGNNIAFLQNKIGEWGIKVINLSTNEEVQIVDEALTNLVSAFDFSPDSSLIVISNGNLSWQNRVSIWDSSNADFITNIVVDGLIEDVDFSSDESVHFVQSDASILVWNFSDNSILLAYDFMQINDNLHEYSFNGETSYLLGSITDNGNPRDRTIYGWNLQIDDEIFFIDVSPNQWHDVLEMNISGDYIAAGDSGYETTIVDIWEIETGRHQQIDLSVED